MRYKCNKHIIVSDLPVKCSLEEKNFNSKMKKALPLTAIEYNGSNTKKNIVLCCETHNKCFFYILSIMT